MIPTYSVTSPPPASSLLANEMQMKQRTGAHSSPADLEGRKTDACCKKVYSSAALNLCIVNDSVIIGGYQLLLWEKMSAYIELLPENKKPLAELLREEALCLSKQQISAGRHSTDSSSGALASVLVLRRHAWLLSRALPPDTRQKMEDLPFERTILFASLADSLFSQIKNKQTACAFGITADPAILYRSPYRSQQTYRCHQPQSPYSQPSHQQPHSLQYPAQHPFSGSVAQAGTGPIVELEIWAQNSSYFLKIPFGVKASRWCHYSTEVL